MTVPPSRDVAVETGDFNEDGTSQIAVGLDFADGAELRFLQRENGGYSFKTDSTMTYGISFADSTIVTLELARTAGFRSWSVVRPG